MRRLLLCARTTRLPSSVSRAFSVTPTLSNKTTQPIDLKPFREFQIAPNRATVKCNLHPTRKWDLKGVEPFCDVQFKSGLGFTEDNLQNVELLPQQRVFAECPARRDDIVEGTWELPRTGLVVRDVSATFKKLQRVLRQQDGTLRVEPPCDKEKAVLFGVAMQLLMLCGFDDGKNFTITCQPIEFKFAGMEINSEADVFVVKRSNKGGTEQPVFIWEDKLPKDEKGKENTTADMLEASAAQIIGEMIAVHYRNKMRNFASCELYAIRLIDDRVAFFRMEMTAEQIEAVCEEGVIPDHKLKVEHVPMDALTAGEDYGVSLLDPDNRLWFVQMMACIRADMLKRELPDLPKWVSNADVEDHDDPDPTKL